MPFIWRAVTSGAVYRFTARDRVEACEFLRWLGVPPLAVTLSVESEIPDPPEREVPRGDTGPGY